jgi:hypothetical protein
MNLKLEESVCLSVGMSHYATTDFVAAADAFVAGTFFYKCCLGDLTLIIISI